MKHQNPKKISPNIIQAVAAFIVLGGVLAYGFVRISALTERVGSLTTEFASTTEILSRDIASLNEQSTGLSNTLYNAQQNIDAVSTKVGGVEQTVGSISGTVGTLQKLSQTDPEFLKKYSKVFFLNENYVPAHLTEIPADNLYNVTQTEEFLSEAWPYLQKLFNAAKSNGVTLYIKSAYRSFREQQSLKSSYTIVYGAGTANSFSADQGYSEHQLGTTVDFITTGLGGQLSGFDSTKAYQWLIDNAYRYGFVLSYPKGNSYYVYEPWHWRFVGVKLATYLHNEKLSFYDVDQRVIDEYLVNIFD
jgi:LAS superfamily LD-carboxypeptidase LdcB